MSVAGGDLRLRHAGPHMKLAVFGDLHLSRSSPRYDHAFHVLDVAVKDAIAQGADAFAFLGDIFEGKPHPREYGDFIGLMLDLASRGMVMIVRGNHEDYEAYSFFGGLSPNVHVAWDEFLVCDLGTAAALLIPYPTRHRRPFHDLADGNTISGSMHAAAARIRGAVQKLCDTARRPVIVLGHFTIEGLGTRDTEFELHQTNEVVVPQAALAPAALTIVGHIHRAQTLTPAILGVGSMYRTSFAEAEDPKCYLMVCIDETARTTERRPTAAREMLDLEVELDDLTPAWVREVADRAHGKEVKVRVHMDADAVKRFDPAAFLPIEQAAAYVPKPERIVRPIQRVRAPDVTTVMTLPEQLAAWMRSTEQAVDPERFTRLVDKIEVLG